MWSVMKVWVSGKGFWVVVLVVACMAAFLGIYKCRPDTPSTGITTDLVKKIQEEVDAQFKAKIAGYEGEIKNLKAQMAESRKRADKLSGEIAQLKKDKADVEKPKNRMELYNLLESLGYKPLR